MRILSISLKNKTKRIVGLRTTTRNSAISVAVVLV
jgi:hypothetical protein